MCGTCPGSACRRGSGEPLAVTPGGSASGSPASSPRRAAMTMRGPRGSEPAAGLYSEKAAGCGRRWRRGVRPASLVGSRRSPLGQTATDPPRPANIATMSIPRRLRGASGDVASQTVWTRHCNPASAPQLLRRRQFDCSTDRPTKWDTSWDCGAGAIPLQQCESEPPPLSTATRFRP
jgi:hypothetical protein